MLVFLTTQWVKLLLLVIIGAASMAYKLFFKIKIGFELVTFVTVLAGMAYGTKAGLIVGASTALLGLVVCLHAAKDPIDTVMNVVLMAGVGWAAGIFGGSNIAVIGAVLTVVFDVFYVPLRMLFYPNLSNYPLYIVGHWLLNFSIFRALGPLALKLLM